MCVLAPAVMQARSGFRVLSINYPLAPEHPFPAAVVSTLRAIAFAKKRFKCTEVCLPCQATCTSEWFGVMETVIDQDILYSCLPYCPCHAMCSLCV